MLNLSNLKPKFAKKSRKRVGRGLGSGHGAYSGRGIKGQKARAGGGIKAGFEGGRMPLVRQMPKKRGFRSPFPKMEIVNLQDVERVFAAGEVVTPQSLRAKGLISRQVPVKLLGNGKLSKTLEFKQTKMPAAARAAVEAAGGKINDVK